VAKIASWADLPLAIPKHLVLRMHDRSITILDLNQLRLWMESRPIKPEGNWYKDFGSFKLCGEGAFPKTFLLRGQVAKGKAL